MRIGILADIHDDVAALRVALAHLQRWAVERIVGIAG